MNYSRYPQYKDSGVPWLGEVPEAWTLTRIKYVARVIGGGTPTKENASYWEGGHIPWVSPKDMTSSVITTSEDTITEEAVRESATNYVEEGMPLIVVRSGILRHTIPVALAGRRLTINQDLKAFSLASTVLPRFFTYWIEGNNDNLVRAWRQMGATVESIDTSLMMGSLFFIPAYKEQQSIVRFLDLQTARIDSLISAIVSLIAEAKSEHRLLREYRTALIAAAVTGKIDVRKMAESEKA